MITNLLKNRTLPKRRRLATQDGCLLDLQEELPIMFKAFSEAFEAFEKEISQTPPMARARGFEASLLNSKMIQSIQDNFPNNWKFGKYKRFTLQKNGYTILFKKLNNKNMPMNIKTNTVNAIAQQEQLSLFDDNSLVANPILYFGYKKSNIGSIVDPKLIYIDDNKLKWIITADDIVTTKNSEIEEAFEETEMDLPKIKEDVKRKKASNE
ncbi:hypothetical protein ABWH96_18955 [Marivirga tractuosa]|uniref:hypothetical protein n=1 Tax=Marivirga tractuosa TaxID=1006 RepID=UPI0035CF1CFE